MDLVGYVLAGGKNSRLFKRLVYDMQIAQNVIAYQNSQALSSHFLIRATPQADTPRRAAGGDRRGNREVVTSRRPIARCSARSTRSSVVLQQHGTGGGFSGKADQLNNIHRDNRLVQRDLARRSLSPTDIRAAVQAFLPATVWS
jgi:zinc protease